jgi:casein kinase II subunit beta
VALITAVQSNFVCHFAGYWDWFSCGFPGTFVKAYNEQFLALSASIAKLLFDLCANRSVVQFISSRGNEYFCEIDEDYLTDRFNLTGLNTEVQYYQYALDLVTDVFDLDCDDEMRETIEKSARHLYGLVHARYIVTTRGLAKMVCDH